jgi:hypothetical protein
MSEYRNFIPRIASPNILKGKVYSILRIFPILVECLDQRVQNIQERKVTDQVEKVQNIITHSNRGGRGHNTVQEQIGI